MKPTLIKRGAPKAETPKPKKRAARRGGPAVSPRETLGMTTKTVNPRAAFAALFTTEAR